MAVQFQHLFSPFRLGSITVRNRIVVPGHATLFMPPDGTPTDRMLHYWLRKARGGVGLIITHNHNVMPRHTGAPPGGIQSDAIIAAYQKVADALHQEGAKFILQLNHPGRTGNSLPFGGVVMGPSPMAPPNPLPAGVETPYEMELEDVQAMVEAFRQAAQRARQAGFDGVEIQGEVSFLVAQFMSPATNLRTDGYGGSLDNRLRFAREVIAAVREGTGPDMVVGIRLSGDEFVENGLRLEDTLEIAPRLEATGHLDYIHVGAGPGAAAHIPPSYYRPGSLVYLTEAVRQVVGLPLICSQRINDPLLAEDVLARGVADLVAMNRAIMADPELPTKAKEGRLEEVRHCIACNECSSRSVAGLPIACAINTEMGREEAMRLTPAARPKRVLIVGGGPAGLEAARVAALRGHQVTLYERDTELGGQARIAARAPGREEFDEIRRYYTKEMSRLKVKVRLGVEATPEVIEGEAPDAVVIATGSRPPRPAIPTAGGVQVVEAREVLEGQVETGKRVVMVAGEHHIQALSTADFLVELGRQVEVLTEAFYAGAQLDPGTLQLLYGRLLRKGVTITPLTLVAEIGEQEVVVLNAVTGAERRIEDVDTVVFACGGEADDSLYHAIRGRVQEVHLIGDALAPRRLMDATLDGARAARQL